MGAARNGVWSFVVTVPFEEYPEFQMKKISLVALAAALSCLPASAVLAQAPRAGRLAQRCNAGGCRQEGGCEEKDWRQADDAAAGDRPFGPERNGALALSQSGAEGIPAVHSVRKTVGRAGLRSEEH